MPGLIMQSVNFEFLRQRWPELAGLGGFAEHYAWPDPAGALVKLRAYVESLIHRFYDEHGLGRPQQASLIELLKQDAFYGSSRVEQLYEAPFTTLHSDGLDGVFADEKMVEALLAVLDSFQAELSTEEDHGHDTV